MRSPRGRASLLCEANRNEEQRLLPSAQTKLPGSPRAERTCRNAFSNKYSANAWLSVSNGGTHYLTLQEAQGELLQAPAANTSAAPCFLSLCCRPPWLGQEPLWVQDNSSSRPQRHEQLFPGKKSASSSLTSIFSKRKSFPEALVSSKYPLLFH